MNSLLITGGAGFIGSSVIRRLGQVLGEQRIVVADVLHPQVHPTRRPPDGLSDNVEFIPFDVTHSDGWSPLIEYAQPHTVLHLAAETGTGQSLAEASRHARVNVTGTAELLDALYRATVRPQHLVLTSSRAVYGDGAWRTRDGEIQYPGMRDREMLERGRWDFLDQHGEPMTAVPSVAGFTEPRPSNVYAATKLAQEHVMDAWCSATGTALTVLRLQNVYGPGQAIHNSYTGVLTHFAAQTAGGKPIVVFEDGQIIRDFVYIDDVADAIVRTIEQPASGRRVFDIGSGTATTIAEVAQSMARLGGTAKPTISGQFRYGDVRAASCSIAHATEVLGYQPQVAIETGLESLLRWATSHEA